MELLSSQTEIKNVKKKIKKTSRNIDDVIRAVLNFFFQKDFEHKKMTKRTKSTKKHKKHQKAQKRNQAKVQNANKRTKIKNALKNI